jgi:hypothetical protein
LRPGQSVHTPWSLKSSFGWYDLVVEAETDAVDSGASGVPEAPAPLPPPLSTASCPTYLP